MVIGWRMKMDDQPNNWGAWLRLVGVIIGGVATVMAAIINNSGHNQKDQHDIKKASDGTPYEVTLDDYIRQKQTINGVEHVFRERRRD
jgi:hypothetical protein